MVQCITHVHMMYTHEKTGQSKYLISQQGTELTEIPYMYHHNTRRREIGAQTLSYGEHFCKTSQEKVCAEFSNWLRLCPIAITMSFHIIVKTKP